MLYRFHEGNHRIYHYGGGGNDQTTLCGRRIVGRVSKFSPTKVPTWLRPCQHCEKIHGSKKEAPQ